MGDDCNALGFEVKGQEGLDTINTDDFKYVIDVYVLGTAIYSKWRCCTHTDYIDITEDRYKGWFIKTLERLIQLCR